MGRKLNLSTPTVINTELIPLSESFYIEADGNLEQWYYENDGRYAPNRKVTPMTLTPHISAFDKDTNQTYTPSFYRVRWFEQAWNETQQDYVETEITNQVDSQSADYVKTGNNLLVKKNVGYTHSVTIICRAEYTDPRDSGITYNVSDEVLLTTNRDATVVTPELDVDCPSSQAFNPLVDNHLDNNDNLVYDSEFTMKASSDYSSVLATNVAQYKVDPLGTEEVIPTNETAVVTSAPTMDIRYGDYEQTNQQFMRRQTSGGQIPYIAGNMAYVNKIKGNTVKWCQLIKNGGFNGTTNWRVSSGSISASNGVCTITTSGNSQGLRQDMATYTVVGHKYLITFEIKGAVGGEIISANIQLSGISGGSKTLSNTAFSSYSAFGTATAEKNVFDVSITNGTFYIKNVRVLDLTAMGIDNLTTVAQVEAWLAANIGLKSYYPYNTGELIPVKMSAIKSVGFNLWDEQWELGDISSTTGDNVPASNRIRTKNFVRISPNATYYIKFGSVASGAFGTVTYYDSSKNLLTGQQVVPSVTNPTITTPANASYLRVAFNTTYGTTYNHDICINLSDASRNGTYEAHWEAEQYLPITELKGKVNGTGDSVVIFPNGMNHVGDVYDEIKVDGGVIKAIKRFERVDLGDLHWFGNNFGGVAGFGTVDLGGKVNNVQSDKYTAKYTTAESSMTQDKTLYYGHNNDGIVVKDSAYSTTSDFTNAVNGSYIVYQLATPVEYIIDNMPRGQFEWYGISNNAEVLVENLPWYKSGQHTDTLVVDAMYGEEIRVVLRSRVSAGSDRLYPNKVYRSIVWKIPDVDTNAYSENGGAVRSNTTQMDFTTLSNVKGATLSDDVRRDNLRFNWKVRKSNSENETDFGWGEKRTIAASDLRNTIGSSSSLASSLVFPYVYLLGAYEKVTDSNEEVTDNDEVVYDRPLF